MKDWVTLLTAIIQCITAVTMLRNGRKQKAPKRRERRKR